MGLKFKIGSDMHYGWVQIDVNRTVTQAVIKAYAYQDIPIGQPGGTLTAGQTASTAVPEPSGLALLALGAAGIAARRRRKQR